jgi:transposase
MRAKGQPPNLQSLGNLGLLKNKSGELSTGVHSVWASGQTDAAAIRQALRQNQQDRCGRPEAICEAVTRPNMRFVQVKTIEQQAVLALHTERDILTRERIACVNSLRAMLAEFGLVMPTGQRAFHQGIPDLLENGDITLSPFVRRSVARQFEHIQSLEAQVTLIEEELNQWAQTQPACQRVMKVSGVGLMTSFYLVASVGNGQQFHSAKQFAA